MGWDEMVTNHEIMDKKYYILVEAAGGPGGRTPGRTVEQLDARTVSPMQGVQDKSTVQSYGLQPTA